MSWLRKQVKGVSGCGLEEMTYDGKKDLQASCRDVSLSLPNHIDKYLKSAIIVHDHPQKTPDSSLNDYKSVALTSTVMKCF